VVVPWVLRLGDVLFVALVTLKFVMSIVLEDVVFVATVVFMLLVMIA